MKTWTQEEVEILKSNYNSVTNDVLVKLIPNKSYIGIYRKAYKMGLRKSKSIEFANRSVGRKKVERKDICLTSKGYKMVYLPEHPRADKSGRVLEHIVVWEKANGRPVPSGCAIHHVNGDKSDNRPENLKLFTHGEHTAYHNTFRRKKHEH